MNPTQILIDNELEIFPEVSDENYLMFNSGGVEIEVGEFLYALVKMVKPSFVLETGTHQGISSSYIGFALKDNGFGLLETIEFLEPHVITSTRLHEKLDLLNFVKIIREDSRKYETDKEIDILFLDSEPQFRFDEFVKFWPLVKEGGYILIHDLSFSFGLSHQNINGMDNWPYGDFRPKIGEFIRNHQLQIISFNTPRNLVFLQKSSKNFTVVNYMKGKDE